MHPVVFLLRRRLNNMDATFPRAADILARRLYDAGCRHAFGMPGGEVLTVVDALEAAGITFHLCKHENAAGSWRKAPITGPEAGDSCRNRWARSRNGLNVVANAQQDRVPLIVISGCVDADETLTYTHQVFDHRAVLAPSPRQRSR
jgi:acetolactate synthase-1/2/3 large subunit